MEREGSLPHSQEPATCTYPEPARSSPYTPVSHFLKIHLNIFLPSMPGSPQWSLSLGFPHQNHVCTSLLTHTRYIPRPSHSSRFYDPNNEQLEYEYKIITEPTKGDFFFIKTRLSKSDMTEKCPYETQPNLQKGMNILILPPLFFCTMTNKCTISQIITLLHVSTLSCHPQTACNQYLATLHQYFKCSCLVIVSKHVAV